MIFLNLERCEIIQIVDILYFLEIVSGKYKDRSMNEYIVSRM